MQHKKRVFKILPRFVVKIQGVTKYENIFFTKKMFFLLTLKFNKKKLLFSKSTKKCCKLFLSRFISYTCCIFFLKITDNIFLLTCLLKIS